MRCLVFLCCFTGLLSNASLSATEDGKQMLRNWKSFVEGAVFAEIELVVNAKEYTKLEGYEGEDTDIRYEQRFTRIGGEWLSTVKRDIGTTKFIFELRRAFGQTIFCSSRKNSKDVDYSTLQVFGSIKADLPLVHVADMWDVRYLLGYYRTNSTDLLCNQMLSENTSLKDLTVSSASRKGAFFVHFRDINAKSPSRIEASFDEEVNGDANHIVARKVEYDVLTWTDDGMPSSLRVKNTDTDGGRQNYRTVLFAITSRGRPDVDAKKLALFRPPANERKVDVEDAPYICVWRDDRIRPAYTTPATVQMMTRGYWLFGASVAVTAFLLSIWYLKKRS